MKPLTIYITGIIVVFIGLGILLVGLMEQSKYSELQEKQIQHLQEQNQAQRDSFNVILQLKDDTIRIAKNTILLQDSTIKTSEADKAKYKRDTHDKIHFINFTNDAGRDSILTSLYPSFRPF